MQEMTDSEDRTRSRGAVAEIRLCAYCEGGFSAKRPQQRFCSQACRLGFHKDVGAEGTVAGVSRIKRGVSVVIHFPTGPAAERAITLLRGESVSVVNKSKAAPAEKAEASIVARCASERERC